jgi:heme A synthase
VALLFAVLATGYAFFKRRTRKDLWVGGLVFTALIVLESYLGGLVRDDSKDTLTAVHVPLAMAIMALAVWLPLRARRTTEVTSAE